MHRLLHALLAQSCHRMCIHIVWQTNVFLHVGSVPWTNVESRKTKCIFHDFVVPFSRTGFQPPFLGTQIADMTVRLCVACPSLETAFWHSFLARNIGTLGLPPLAFLPTRRFRVIVLKASRKTPALQNGSGCPCPRLLRHCRHSRGSRAHSRCPQQPGGTMWCKLPWSSCSKSSPQGVSVWKHMQWPRCVRCRSSKR